MSPDYGISPDQLSAIYEDQVFPVAANGVGTDVERPTVVFVAGAPGAGTRLATDQTPQRLSAIPMMLDADQLRAFHPDYQQLSGLNPALALEVSSGAVDEWMGRLRQDAMRMGAHLVGQTELRRPGPFLDVVRELKAFDYRVEVQVLATHPHISAVATIARAEAMIAKVGTARTVPLDYHDRLVANLPGAVDAINQRPALIDSLQITTRGGTVLWSGPEPSNPGEVLRREFTRPLSGEEATLLDDTARWARQSQRLRGASAAEQRPLDRVVERRGALMRGPDPAKLNTRPATSRYRRPWIRRSTAPVPKPGLGSN